MKRIHEKIKKGETKEITQPDKETSDEPRSAKVIDLAELLKQSLGGKKAGGEKTTERRAAASRHKPHLRVVASQRAAAKQVKRKRA
jgi:non-homologous end joining protein Ku